LFGIGPLELVVIVVLALILLGPEKFPEAGRTVGKTLREFRALTSDLTRDITSSLDDPQPRVRTPRTAVSKQPEADDHPKMDDADQAPPDDNQPGPV